MSYDKNYSSWKNNPVLFWEEKAKNIDWFKPWKKTLEEKESSSWSWFTGGSLNTCYNCIDRHIKRGKGDKVAIIFDSPITNYKNKITYNDLYLKVSSLAASLEKQGVTKGDRVILYMPMIPEVIVSMLACARIGAIHSVVFGGFASKELASRIEDVTPKVIISASCGLEPNKIIDYKKILDESIAISAHKPLIQIIYQRKEKECLLNMPGDISWNDSSVPTFVCTAY